MIDIGGIVANLLSPGCEHPPRFVSLLSNEIDYVKSSEIWSWVKNITVDGKAPGHNKKMDFLQTVDPIFHDRNDPFAQRDLPAWTARLLLTRTSNFQLTNFS